MRRSDPLDLVLVGGGHAHVQVLRGLAMRPLTGVRTCVILDRPEAVYSGMVPGLVAGDYETHELEIDVVPLARRAGARVVLAAATRVDPRARRVELAGRPSLSYDVASLDVGSSVRGLDLPGVREHALATRPIRQFVDTLERRLEQARARSAGGPLRLAVVGTGVAGIELAFTLEARARGAAGGAEVVVLGDSEEILPGQSARVARRVRREAERRGFRLHTGVRVTGVEKDALLLDGERLPADLVVWATGAAPPSLLGESPLPRDAAGFVRVRDTLQVEGRDDLFAVGDCASQTSHPWVPRAGVYAVRQGPVLEANLRARLTGARLRAYRPQRHFLALVNLGDGRALGAKWGATFAGPAAWRLKDWIDRRFVRRFQALTRDGEVAEGVPTPEEMGMAEMECGGCAAKLAAAQLAPALARLGPPPPDPSVRLGLEAPDDAAALVQPDGQLLLATLDAFRAFADDPWLVGRVAAVNAASDVFAKGAVPSHALALVSVPELEPRRAEETLYQVLAGVRAALDPLAVSLVGGHTTRGEELYVGLTVLGRLEAGREPIALGGARPGEVLILSKPLGTGVLLAADMRGLARGEWVARATDSMLRANADAARIARECGASACTDVSGFGLAGHLVELLRASGAAAELRSHALPALPGALPLLARGLRSTFHAQNAADRDAWVGFAGDAPPGVRAAAELLYDPQTSGGLVFSLPAARAPDALRALVSAGDEGAAAIGRVISAQPGEPPLRLV